ncbi:MAG: gluconate 2-dehydrogenase subunit 3 family protein [Pseudomonadota bacterium]
MTADRREFLAQLSQLTALAAVGTSLPGCRRVATAEAPPLAVEGAALETLRELVDHVLPADEEPGALAAGCAEFMSRELAKTQFAVLRSVVERGLTLVEADLKKRGVSSLAALEVPARDEVLRSVERARVRGFDGRRFVHLLVVLTLEGFLSDPRHGGNRGGVGWRFARFTPVRWGPDDDRAWREETP